MVKLTRNNYSSEFKEKVIKEALEKGNCALVARRHDITGYTVRDWLRAHKVKNKGKSSHKESDNNSSAKSTIIPEQLS